MVDHGWYWQTRELHAWHNEKSVALDSAPKFLQWHTHKIQVLLRWITRRGFLQCKYAFLVCQPGIKSTCGGGQHFFVYSLTALYYDTKNGMFLSQLWILGDYTTHASQFSEISTIVVVIVDSVPILLLIIKSAQEYSLFARDWAYKNACMLQHRNWRIKMFWQTPRIFSGSPIVFERSLRTVQATYRLRFMRRNFGPIKSLGGF